MYRSYMISIRSKIKYFDDNGGAAMVIAMGVVVILAVAGLSMMQQGTNEYQSIIKNAASSKSSAFAEAGIEKALKELNADSSYAGTTSPVTLGDGQYEISIAGGASEKVITAIGYQPSKTNPDSSRKVSVTVSLTQSLNGSFDFAIHGDTGGVVLDDHFTVRGSVYSNANITGQWNEPTIQGNAYAVNHINYVRVTGVERQHQPARPLPEFDMDVWRNAAAAGGTRSSLSMSSGSIDLGPKKIDGDLTITGGEVNMTGPIWVTGDIFLRNADISLDDSFGSNSTLLFCDGIVRMYENAYFYSSADGGYIMTASTYSGSGYGIYIYGGWRMAAYCKDDGIYVHHHDTYDSWRDHHYHHHHHYDDDSSMYTLVGKQVYIENYDGNFTYSSGLSSTQFSTNGSGSKWTIKPGSWRERS